MVKVLEDLKEFDQVETLQLDVLLVEQNHLVLFQLVFLFFLRIYLLSSLDQLDLKAVKGG